MNQWEMKPSVLSVAYTATWVQDMWLTFTHVHLLIYWAHLIVEAADRSSTTR